MALFLGIDIGTTSTIGILIDDVGGILGVVSRPVTLYSQYANWAEEDTEEWWRNAGEIVRELVARYGAAADKITGAGVTGMLPAVILVDDSGTAIRRSIQQNDARAVEELDRFRGGMEDGAFVGLTGTGYSQQLVDPKLMWLREHKPEAFRRTRYVMGASDYITSLLSSTFQLNTIGHLSLAS
jgi:xylulokinase